MLPCFTDSTRLMPKLKLKSPSSELVKIEYLLTQSNIQNSSDQSKKSTQYKTKQTSVSSTWQKPNLFQTLKTCAQKEGKETSTPSF